MPSQGLRVERSRVETASDCETRTVAGLQVMGEKGIALQIGPNEGLLPPWGHFTCTLTCSTDMCGDYTDVLHVQVGFKPLSQLHP